MSLFLNLVSYITTGINSGFSYFEAIFGAFGISLLVLVVCIAVSSFFVNHFVRSFLK